MLPFLTEEIRTCLVKAADQTDPKLKQDLLKLKEHWLSVARKRLSHDIGDQLVE
jgi:hypothetical protein